MTYQYWTKAQTARRPTTPCHITVIVVRDHTVSPPSPGMRQQQRYSEILPVMLTNLNLRNSGKNKIGVRLKQTFWLQLEVEQH